MRKKIIIGILILIEILLINCNVSISASSITYLYLDSIKIDDSNIEILSNEVLIDTTTSKIENTINAVGLMLLMVLMVVITWNDILRFIL